MFIFCCYIRMCITLVLIRNHSCILWYRVKIWHRSYISVQIVLSYQSKIEHVIVSHLIYSFTWILLRQKEKRRWHKKQHISQCRTLKQQPTERARSRRNNGFNDSANKNKDKMDIAEPIPWAEKTRTDSVTNGNQIQGGFIWVIGPEALYQMTRAEYKTEPDRTAIKDLIWLSNENFWQKRNTYHNRGGFFWTKEIEPETLEDFWRRLIKLKKKCNRKAWPPKNY